MGISGKLGEIPADVRFGICHLPLQQVKLVQEENDRNPFEYPIVHDGVEDVPRLLQPVRLPILQQHLVELGGRHQEEDRGDRVETLEPLLPLRPLAADVDEEEWDVVDGNDEFCDAFGCLPAVQDVFVRGRVVRRRYPLQVVEEVFD